MIFSHSRINLILDDIYGYYLNHIYKIRPYKKAPALLIGNAVHYGIENQTKDLDDFFKQNGDFKQKNEYSNEQIVSEALTHLYLTRQNEIMDDILKDCTVLNEESEKKLTAPLSKSKHYFLGIIDKLITTDKGFIVIDYKTTSKTPNYSDYIEQLYRYCFLLNRTAPATPIYKVVIISLKKPSIKIRKNEDEQTFKRRLIAEYEDKPAHYLDYYTFNANNEEHKDIFSNANLINYYNNLEDFIVYCNTLINQQIFPINYAKAFNLYGKNVFYDFIYWNVEKIKNLYYVEDLIYNTQTQELQRQRPLLDFDLEIIKTRNKDVTRKSIFLFKNFVSVYEAYNQNVKQINALYLTDPDLIQQYIDTYNHIFNNPNPTPEILQIRDDFKQYQ